MQLRKSLQEKCGTSVSYEKNDNNVTSYSLEDRVFPPLPPRHPAVQRRREVRRFRSGVNNRDERPQWNPATRDELHPFPDHFPSHSTACYNGVEVVATHFPETIKGTAFLRLPESTKPALWHTNARRATESLGKHSYQNAQLADKTPPLSYLAQKVVEDGDPAKKERRQQWCASTVLPDRSYLRGTPVSKEMSFVERNKAVTKNLTQKHYISPVMRVERLNASRRAIKKLQEQAETETLDDFYHRPDAPAVFKMSNIDQWWNLNPVEVSEEFTMKRDNTMKNPFSLIFADSFI